MFFKYLSGQCVELGDIIKTDFFGIVDDGFVDSIVEPYSEEAKQLSCYETGGIMFRIGREMSMVLMPEPDEHFIFVHRRL